MHINKVYNRLINRLFDRDTKHCFLCYDKIPHTNCGLCAGCLSDFPINHYACNRCGNALPAYIYKTPFMSPDNFAPVQHSCATSNSDFSPNHFNYTCGDCIARPPAWHKLIALCQYEYPVSRLIQGIKYNGKFANIRLLSQLFIAELQKRNPDGNKNTLPECILPVPLHPARQKQRGFNQAIELARPIAREFGLSLNITHCIRALDTPSQSSLEHDQRLYNLHDAFSLKQALPYKHVAIFDDVVTTGSTVTSLCKLLYNSGVERVDVWCIARASKNN